MKITNNIIVALSKGADKIKRIEAQIVPTGLRKDSAWLGAINDIIDRTALAIRDELEVTDES